MTGFLNAHGTSPCLFGGEFLDFSIVTDDERRDRRVLDVPDTSKPTASESLDPHFEEVFWESLFLGADFDWDDEPTESIEDWLQRRYGDVIKLNERYGFQHVAMNDNQIGEDDKLPAPAFYSCTQPRVENDRVAEELRGRSKYPYHTHNCGRKQAKWRSSDGTRARKDTRRWRERFC